jgi:hypothetical protein
MKAYRKPAVLGVLAVVLSFMAVACLERAVANSLAAALGPSFFSPARAELVEAGAARVKSSMYGVGAVVAALAAAFFYIWGAVALWRTYKCSGRTSCGTSVAAHGDAHEVEHPPNGDGE